MDDAEVFAVAVLQLVRGVKAGGGVGDDAHRDAGRDALLALLAARRTFESESPSTHSMTMK